VHGIYTGGSSGRFYAQDDRTFERITAVACRGEHAIGVPVEIGCTALSTRVFPIGVVAGTSQLAPSHS